MKRHRLCFPQAIRRRKLWRNFCFHYLYGYEFQSLARDLHRPDIQLGKAVIRALRECLQEEYGQSLSEEQIAVHADQVRHNPKVKEQLLPYYISREVMTLQPIFSFRDADVSIQVEARGGSHMALFPRWEKQYPWICSMFCAFFSGILRSQGRQIAKGYELCLRISVNHLLR